MEHNTENCELQRCRDYEAELMECEKANLFCVMKLNAWHTKSKNTKSALSE